jgi:hypothetical protein
MKEKGRMFWRERKGKERSSVPIKSIQEQRKPNSRSPDSNEKRSVLWDEKKEEGYSLR